MPDQMNPPALHDLAGVVKDIAHRRAGIMSAYEVANLEIAHEQLNRAAQEINTLTEVRAAHAEYQRTGDLHELARAMNTLLGPS